MSMQRLGQDLYIVEGPVVRDMGLPFATRMTVARLPEGSLWIASPVAVPYDILAEIAELGPVRYLVSPTPRHYWRLAPFHRLFPDAELWSSPITPVTLKKRDLPLAGILGDSPPRNWATDLDQVLVRGSRVLAEVVFFHGPSRTLLVEDLLQLHRPRAGHPLVNALIAWGGVDGEVPAVPRDIRMTFRDRAAARQSIKRILQWDFDTLVMAHGPVVTTAARSAVEDAFSWLLHDQGSRWQGVVDGGRAG